MTTKEAVLLTLLQKDTPCSGEALAREIGVSRTAVWKAAKALAASGVPIVWGAQKGYFLEDSPLPYLHERRMAAYLQGEAKNAYRISVVDEIPSTNTALKLRAAEGEAPLAVLLARRQTGGRGRLGRAFFSPDTGLYMSVLFRPTDLPITQALSLTTMAAVAVTEALEACMPPDDGEEIKIKWVNDLYLRDKKICGILTEAATDLETGCLSYAVLGIGINLLPPKDGFPRALADVAGALCNDAEGAHLDGNRIAAEILTRLYAYAPLLSDADGIAELGRRYRARSLLDGRHVWVCKQSSLGGDSIAATALYVDENMGLCVRYDDGSEEILTSGEVQMASVHLAKGEVT